MLTIEESIEIPRSPQAVYEFVSDYRNAPKFMAGFDSFEVLDAPTASPGSRIRASGSILGMRVDSVLEVIEIEPNRLIRIRSLHGPSGESSWRFEQLGLGTKVTLSMVLEGTGGIIQRMVTSMIRDTVRESLARLGREFGSASGKCR